MPKLAIAHIAADEFIARKMRTMLAEFGYDVSFDPMVEPWDPSRLLGEGSAADAVILLLSGQWVETEWPHIEAGTFDDEPDLVIPVLISTSYGEHLSSSSAWLDDAIVVVNERPDFLDQFVDQLRARLSARLPDHRVELFSNMMLDEDVACFPPEMKTWDGMRHYFDEVVQTYRHLDNSVGVFDYIQTQHAITEVARPELKGRSEELTDRSTEAAQSKLPDVHYIQHHLHAGLSLLSVGVPEQKHFSGSTICTSSASRVLSANGLADDHTSVWSVGGYRIFAGAHHGCAVNANVVTRCLPRLADSFEAALHRDVYRCLRGSWASSYCRHLRDNCFDLVSACPQVITHSNTVGSDEGGDVFAVSHLDVDHLFALTRARLTELQETLEHLLRRLLSPPNWPAKNTVDALRVHQCNVTRTLLEAPGLDYASGTTFIQDYVQGSVSRALTPSSAWTDERISELRTLWSDGYSASEIARLLGADFTRNQVIGKVHRLGLAAGTVQGARPIYSEADADIGPAHNSLVAEVAVDPEGRTEFGAKDAFRFALTSWQCGAWRPGRYVGQTTN